MRKDTPQLDLFRPRSKEELARDRKRTRDRESARFNAAVEKEKKERRTLGMINTALESNMHLMPKEELPNDMENLLKPYLDGDTETE